MQVHVGLSQSEWLETSNTLAQLGQFPQRGVGAAPAIKEAVNFLHDVAHGSQLRQTTGNPELHSLKDWGVA
jgi:hypothetical protein